MNRTTTGAYGIVADGIKSTMTMPTYITGNYAQSLQDQDLGYHGQCMFPARLDHSHPLNVMSTGDLATGQSTGDFVKPIGSVADFGTSKYYARQDHVHTLQGTTGLAYDLNGIIISGGEEISIVPGYGDENQTESFLPLNTTWTRGVTQDRDGIKCGFKVKVITAMREESGGGSICYMWREFEFDSNGCVKSVSKEYPGEWYLSEA